MKGIELGWLEQLQGADSLEDIHKICSLFCVDHGFDSFHYGARLPTSLVKPIMVFVSGYPMAWWNRYLEEQYIQNDPTVAFCMANHIPLEWQNLRKSGQLSDMANNIMGEAGEAGLKEGVSFSVHSPKGEFAMFSLASELPDKASCKIIEGVKPYGQLFALYLHEAIQRISKKQALASSQIDLSVREKECMLWAAEGKTTWEISKILNLSERTVIYHLQNVVEKMQVNNRTHAIVKAIASGVISPQFS